MANDNEQGNESTQGAPPQVLFVCSGNYYRSRLAELLFNHFAREQGVKWEAVSRGILDQVRQKGLAPHAVNFLEKRGLKQLAENQRNPISIRMDDLEGAQQVVILSRREHEPMMLTRFGQIPRMMAEQGILRYWNIDDLPPPVSLGLWLGSLLDKRPPALGQSVESATEHLEFAVKALVSELAAKE